jgi:hypothetical protein
VAIDRRRLGLFGQVIIRDQTRVAEKKLLKIKQKVE